MTRRPKLLHLITAIAFLSATPIAANSLGPVFLPNLQFAQDTQHPTRAGTDLLQSCKTDAVKAEICSVEARRALTVRAAPKK